MLVLTRKVNEQILIGDDIRITVVAVRGNQVRLGFEAPKHVSIQRQELVNDPFHVAAGPEDSGTRLGRVLAGADLRSCFARDEEASR